MSVLGHVLSENGEYRDRHFFEFEIEIGKSRKWKSKSKLEIEIEENETEELATERILKGLQHRLEVDRLI